MSNKKRAVVHMLYNHKNRRLILVFDDYKTEIYYGEEAVRILKELDYD